MHKVVITTDVSGAREQFIDCVTGYIVPIESDLIAQRIMWCINHPEEKRRIEEHIEKAGLYSNDSVDRLFLGDHDCESD